jgi:hypothetical protein
MCIHEKYINPFTDYGFEKIFGDEENTELLESLINDILGLEGEKKIAKHALRMVAVCVSKFK